MRKKLIVIASVFFVVIPSISFSQSASAVVPPGASIVIPEKQELDEDVLKEEASVDEIVKIDKEDLDSYQNDSLPGVYYLQTYDNLFKIINKGNRNIDIEYYGKVPEGVYFIPEEVELLISGEMVSIDTLLSDGVRVQTIYYCLSPEGGVTEEKEFR